MTKGVVTMPLIAKVQLVQRVGGVWCKPINDVATTLCEIARQKTLTPRLVGLAQEIGIVFEYSHLPDQLDFLINRWMSAHQSRQEAVTKSLAKKNNKKAAPAEQTTQVLINTNQTEQVLNCWEKERIHRGHDDETALDLLGISSDQFTSLLRTEEGRKQLEERAEKARLKMSS